MDIEAGGAAGPAKSAQPWYVKPKHAIWLGPVLIAACLALRFGWGGIEGPPFPFWGIAYLIGIAGIGLLYVGIADRGRD